MSGLVSVLFPEPSLRRSAGAVVRWWEARRPMYNAIVGTAGALTLLALHLTVLPWHALLLPRLWAGVAVYAVAANACYSLGAPVELLLQRWLRRETYGLGPALFRHGLVFSVGLTCIPVAIVWTAWFAGHLLSVIH